MTTEVKVIADSISPDGIRLTTFQLKYWRAIHAELMTHRAFSRNASSSRAIPINKMIEAVLEDPAMPVHWGKNQAGMQAREELTGAELEYAKDVWLKAARDAVWHAQNMRHAGVHKQIVNRLLEPWQHIHVLVTATDFTNWFGLRIHPDAQPEIQALADAMWHAREKSIPKILTPGDWHLPYIDAYDRAGAASVTNSADECNALLCRVSAARCARVSYLKHDGDRPVLSDDIELFDRLAGSQPIHASPLEHQATPDEQVKRRIVRTNAENFSDDCRLVGSSVEDMWLNPHLHGNFTGWVQFRKTLPGERITEFTHPSEKAA